jgi:hypothetical protein
MHKPTEEELLLPFERAHFRPPFREFLSGRRGAFINTIQAFPDIWYAFEVLDETWMTAINTLRVPGGKDRILPVLLLLNAHVRVQIAFELAFSRCLSEAGAVLRNAIESVAYADNFLRKPVEISQLSGLLPTQLQSAEQQERLSVHRVMKREFKKREAKLFLPKDRLGRLHQHWYKYSERGSHMTFGAMSLRLLSLTEASTELSLHYNDAPRDTTYAVLITFLDCCQAMHEVLVNGFRTRLELNPEFLKLSQRFTSACKASEQKFVTSQPMPLIWTPKKKSRKSR